jgi:hypothetical protein
MIEEAYIQRLNQDSDIVDHLPLLKSLANGKRIIEFGVREGNSTIAFLAGKPKWLKSYDVNPFKYYESLKVANFTFTQKSDLEIEPEECDVLFIDTVHNYEQIRAELELHGSYAKEIVIHDTTLFGKVGEDGKEGINKAIEEWLAKNFGYKCTYCVDNCCGLTILERQ